MFFSANNYAQSHKRKTLTATDVFQALADMEFEAFVDPLKSCLERKYHTRSIKNQKTVIRGETTA